MLSSPSLFAQLTTSCAYDSLTPSAQQSLICPKTTDNSLYTPDQPNQIRTKQIDVILNIMQKEFPLNPDNFEDNTTDRAFLREIIDSSANFHVLKTLEKKYVNGQQSNDDYIADAHFKLNIVDIRFIPNNVGWNNGNSQISKDVYDNHAEKTDAALNIFFTEGMYTSSGPLGVVGVGHDNFILINGYYKSYIENDVSTWSANWLVMGEFIIHELGHTLGLGHSWDECGFITDLPPCPLSKSGCDIESNSDTACVNNIMSYAAIRRWMSPLQLGEMHRYATNESAARFVKHSKLSGTQYDIHINSDTTWTRDRYIYGDIYVETGNTLTINCKILMPPNSRIIVKRGARLYVDCGTITGNRTPLNSIQQENNGDYWNGIEVWGNVDVAHVNGMSSIIYTPNVNDPGIVLFNEAEISHAHSAVYTYQTGAYPWSTKKLHFGGYINAKNTKFHNNQRAIEMMRYEHPNKSRFVDCTFSTDNGDSFAGATIWATEGVTFQDCNFEDITAYGVLGYDAGFGVYGCTFDNVHHGVQSFSSLPMVGSIFVGERELDQSNTFDNCDVGVFATTTDDINVYDNDFTENECGIAIDSESKFLLENNTFIDNSNSVNITQTEEFGDNIITCNVFSDDRRGIYFKGNNVGSRFLYNSFSNTNTITENVSVLAYFDYSNFYMGQVREIQSNDESTTDKSAGNLFVVKNVASKRHILTNDQDTVNAPFTYYHSDPATTPRVYPTCGIGDSCTNGGNLIEYNFNYNKQNNQHNSICSSNIGGNDPCEHEDCYYNAYDEHVLAESEYENDPSDTNLLNLVVSRTAKYKVLREVIRYYRSVDSFANIYSILNNENTNFAKRATFGLKVIEQDYTGARTYLNAMSKVSQEQQDFYDIQIINIDRYEYGDSIALTKTQENTLIDIADGITPLRGYARAILSQEKGAMYEPVILDSIQSRSLIIEEEKIPQLTIVPNPNRGKFYVELENAQFKKIDLISITGQLIDSRNFSERQKVQLDYSSIMPGIYFVRAQTVNNQIIIGKLVKQ